MKKFVARKTCLTLIIALLITTLLFGCAATKYQPADGKISGGYYDIKVGPKMYRVSFEGNAYITSERAFQYALYRAAEITKENNYEWFEIIEKEETKRRDWAGFFGYVEKPRIVIIFKIIEKETSGQAFFVNDILNSISLN